MSVTDKELDDLEKEITAKKAAEPAPPPETPAEPSAPPSAEPPPAAAAAPTAPEPPPTPPSEPPPFDAAEWVKKKGWTKPEDVAKSMRELENAYHKSQEENARLKREQQQPPFQPGWPQPPSAPWAGYPPAYQQSAPWAGYPPYQQPAPPQYAPPANPYAPPAPWNTPAQRPNEEQIAAAYGIDPNDFRRVVPLINDIAAVQAKQLAQEINAWRERTERENEKASDLQNVMTDPAFHRPEVQFEMHDLFEKNKNLWNERRPYSTALEKALTSIARKSMGGAYSPSGSTLPTEPPKNGGHAGGGLPGKRGLGSLPTPEEQRRMSADDLEKLLRNMNAVRTYEDLA